MDESTKDDATDGSRFVGRIGFRRSRLGNRLWPPELKGRIVRESLAPGARVADVARKYGICAQQLTEWRRAARSGRLALVADDPAEFVEIELNEPTARSEADARIEIVIGKVVLRLEKDTASTRIAEIMTALASRHASGRRSAPTSRLLPRRVHLPLQPPTLKRQGPSVPQTR